MLEIGRAYLDACGYVDGVFEEQVIRATGEKGEPTHHIIHAPNGVGKTTILALLFSIFEPDRRKFLRTEIKREHKIEHYFMPGRLGVVALELVRPGVNNKPVCHVIGQVFWLTPASKGDDGEPGHRRFFGFQCDEHLTLDNLPFRGLSGQAPLRSLDDFTRWAREMRVHPTFFATDGLAAWRKYLVSELGVELKVMEVQRRFCAAEGGIGKVFLDFKSEEEFLKKIFAFLIPPDAAESVVMALETGLAKIRGLPQRKDQLGILRQLSERFAPFFDAATSLHSAEAERTEDFKRLGRLFTRFKTEQAKLGALRDTVAGEIAISAQQLTDARQQYQRLQGEVLFLERTAAERRISDAKLDVEKTKLTLDAIARRLRAVRAADVARKLSSAREQQSDLEAELERIERDLAPDRARLARAGANIHALLERLALEAERDSTTRQDQAVKAQQEADGHQQIADEAIKQALELKAEVTQLSARVTEHDRERKDLERAGAVKATEAASMALERLGRELAALEDAAAEMELSDEALQQEATALEGTRKEALGESRRVADEAVRLAKLADAGRLLEHAILENSTLPPLLAGETKDPYRPDLPERARAARGFREETYRQLSNDRKAIAEELAFLDAEGVASVPEDVALVAQALKDEGYADAQPAEHYLAQFKPEAQDALALLRRDPARFSGVFVARLNHEKLGAFAAQNRLRLKGPVLVSEATLEPSSRGMPDAGIVFGPLSASRINKQAAAEEKAQLAAALDQKDSELASVSAELEALRALIDSLRDLHASYREQRPDELFREVELLRSAKIAADKRAEEAAARQQAITKERSQLRLRLQDTSKHIGQSKRWLQDVQQFSRRHASIAEAIARIPIARAEQRRAEDSAERAKTLASQARQHAVNHHTDAAGLRAAAAAKRADKVHYPETDGGPSDRTGTLEDLRNQYKSAERVLASKRDAQQATVSMRLTSVKESILTLEQEYAQAMQGFAAADLEPFAATADLERATRDVEQAHLESRDAFTRAESTLQSAHSRLGPIVRKIENAEKKDGLKPIAVPEFAVADAEACDTECNRRQQLVEGLEGKIKTLDRACNGLETRLGEIKTKLGEMNALVRRAEDHLPEVWRAELVDYSLPVEELEGALDQLVARLGHAITEIQRLEKAAEDLFEQVRQLIELDTFRRLEPQVADNLRRFSARSAGAERTTLRDRLVERIAVVQEEIDNQLRDQNACLEQLRLHVIHADDLLRRAVRCSRIPDQVPIYGGERLLKVKRRLNDVPPDTVRNQLSIWLDEQVVTGRVPQDGTALAAELLHRVHGGRPLDIEILKPKRDAIQPYMAVDKLGVSGGEGVTVAMMLYTVIQRMAMDERTDGKNAASGGFLMLDNTYGTSNLMEHIVLQKTMADALGIQLFVTTCSEDKHVLNMFPTITRLVQGERVLQGGVPKYIRVRSADYLFKSAGHAA